MHVKGTDKQADHRISTHGLIEAVRSNCDLPVRAWGAASTQKAFNRLQEALRKEAERLFGILMERFDVALHPGATALWRIS